MPNRALQAKASPWPRIATSIVAGLVCALMTGTSASNAAPSSTFWSKLDRDGYLSAGWVQVLPVLSSACSFRLDPAKLSATLIDLSRAEGNRDYTLNLYSTLSKIEKRRAANLFVEDWNRRFHGDQTAACATAERLWGNAGSQFSGILIRDASTDATATINQSRPNNCQ